jgi:exopolysaccharide biosynthesis polyprenyl glycosylphosphotransferase
MDPGGRKRSWKSGFEWWRGPVRPVVRVSEVVLALQLVADVVAVAVAYALAFHLWPPLARFRWISSLHEVVPARNYWINALVTLCVQIPVFRAMGLYEQRHSLLNIEEYRNILRGWALTLLLSVLAVASIERSFQSRGIFLLVWFLLLATLVVLRFGVYRTGLFLRQLGWWDRRILIYGAGQSGKSLLRTIQRSPKTGLDVAGFVDDDEALHGALIEGVQVLGGGTELASIVGETGASEIILALPRAKRSSLVRILGQCRSCGIAFRLVPSLFDMVLLQVETMEIGGIPLIGIHAPRLTPVHALAKRIFDLVVGSLAALAALPLLLALALAIRLVDGCPPLFSQRRVGHEGRHFRIYKLRTMRPDAPIYAQAPRDPHDGRITLLGRLLRRTSLDELPQLWNVLRGEMSLVGPRPEMPFVVESYDELQRQRLAVKPGMTGLWQVSPERAEPIHAHMDYDIYYIRHQSLLLDLAILLKTVFSVLGGKGAV